MDKFFFENANFHNTFQYRGYMILTQIKKLHLKQNIKCGF